jgi:4-aminobutyrate aminotransferase/(S)-3-amino-2-methylpropionate transaminase
MNSVHASGLGGTYGGNPIACAASLAVIETIEEENLIERARTIGQTMRERLTKMQSADPRIGDVRGRGAMMAIELVDADGITPDAAITKRVAAAAHSEGVLVLTCGTYGNVLRFLPPLSMPDHLLHEAFDVLERIFEETR